MRHLLFCCSSLLVLAACDGARVHHASGDTSVSPDVLTLPDTFVGVRSHAAVTVTNAAGSSRTFSLAVTGPFIVDDQQLTVPAATDVALTVTFVADQQGAATGHLTLAGEGTTFDVTLTALARAVPDCAPAGPCAATQFDPQSGACIEVPVADGAVCLSGSACLLDAQCLAGQCVGTPRSCDDGNACTTDACDAETGCVHYDSTAACPPPADLCHAAVCDPVTGCGSVEVADGTSCGAADCVTAQVCMRGACQVLPVPNGAACGTASPCQAPGVCQGTVCVQTVATPMVPAWSYQPPPSVELTFNGLADLAGNLYWVEHDLGMSSGGTGYELVSADANGVVRYRVPMGAALTSAPLIADGLVIVGWASQLHALRTADGTEAWSLNLLSLPIANVPLVPPSTFQATSVVDDGHGGLVLLAHMEWYLAGALTSSSDLLLGLTTATGATRWTHVFTLGELPRALAADEAGQAWVAAHVLIDAGNGDAVLGFSGAGNEVARANAPGTATLAVAGGTLALPDWGGLTLVSASAPYAAPLSSLNWTVSPDEPLLGLGGAALLQAVTTCPPVGPCPMSQPGFVLGAYAVPTGQAQWSRSISSTLPGDPSYVASGLALTTTGDLLFARSLNRFAGLPEAPTLRSVTSSGADRWVCELPQSPDPGTARMYEGATLLNGGRWFVGVTEDCFVCDLVPSPRSAIVAFDVPGAALPSTGWTTSRGNSQRSGRPR